MHRFLSSHADTLVRLLGGILCISLAAFGYWYFALPTTLSVAAGPPDSPEMQIMGTYAKVLEATKQSIRLKVVPCDDLRLCAEALHRGEVDLATIRPDVLLPGNGLTIAVLRDEALILLAPAESNAKNISDLRGKSVAIIRGKNYDFELIKAVLEQHASKAQAVNLKPIDPSQIELEFRAGRVQALVFLANPTNPAAVLYAQAMRRATGGTLSVLPISDAKSIAASNPLISATTFPQNVFNSAPPKPQHETETLSVSYRLAAAHRLDRSTISSLTQYIFQLRSRVARTAPAVYQMKAPDVETSTSAVLPVHPGAIDYLEYGQQTFMELYGDWLWLALFSAGGISSGLAWMAQTVLRQRRELVDQVLDRLTEILQEARSAETSDKLEQLELEIEELVAHAIRVARRRSTGARTLSALTIAIDSARVGVERRRRAAQAHDQ